MDLNDLIESNPGLFRVIAIVGGSACIGLGCQSKFSYLANNIRLS